MKLELAIIAAAVAVLSTVTSTEAADATRQPNSYGSDVVEAVVNIIRESCLFADDRRFLRRLAYAESQDGSAPDTFRSGYYGGIWQLDEAEFLVTQGKSSLQSRYDIIRDVIGINWAYVTWSDLRKPLYSGIAAALYTILRSQGSPLSWKVEEQGMFWENNFHNGSSANNFTVLAKILDQGCKANQAVDMVFLIDTSSSLDRDDFDRARNFVSQVVDGFDISPTATQVGVITYSTEARVSMYLNSHSSKTSLQTAINGITNNPGGTATDLAITKAVNEVFNTSLGARANAVKVMVIITDGNSDDDINTRHAADIAHALGIVTFSVGIGSDIGQAELHNLASYPDCTHAYTVKTYEEIKFMKEEIQKATCIAPLYIDSTYSCILDECPPLVTNTGPNGTTIETNITCGGMAVYSAFNNPYPNKAQYETLDNVLATDTTQQHYYNETGRYLYINLKDNQYGGVSGNCTATITPKKGDTTAVVMTYKCFRNGVEIPCDPSQFKCKENWNFANPCTKENILNGITRFAHPYESNKFLICDLSQIVYIAICPPDTIFFDDCKQCLGENSTTVSTGCTAPLQTNVSNPCTRENILANKMYFAYPGDPHKYIHCDVWGHPWERDCQQGQLWGQDLQTCYVPGTNPCLHHVQGTPYLYPHHCDPHKYIHCDTNHQSFIQDCELDYVFLESSLTCVPPGTYNTGNLVNTCPGSSSNTATTSSYNPGTAEITTAKNAMYTTPPYNYQTSVASGVSGVTSIQGYEFSRDLHVLPCTQANIDANEFYFPYKFDNQHYIQCGIGGQQYLRDCSPDYYDPISHTCVDGPVFVDNIVG